MSLPNELLPVGLLGTGAAEEGYSIERSVRFNSSDSAYLSRTPASAGNRKTWTWAGWVKLSKESTGNGIDQQALFGASNSDSNNRFRLLFQTPNNIRIDQTTGGSTTTLLTSAVYRDFSSWAHIVFAFDTTQATSSDRAKLYWNGVQVTDFSTESYLSQNADTSVNSTVAHNIGRRADSGDYYLDGYLADIHFIDGQALDPTSFGEFDTNGIWQPIEYTGTYGTNGFYLDFSDNSTAAALGTDTSGNSNTWTVNNISVTAGAGNDSLVDVPTNGTETDTGVGGEVRGNYCTLNPLFKTGAGTPAYSNGNLDLSAGGSGDSYFAGTFLFSTGKYYYEATINAVGNGVLIGVCRESDSTSLSNIGSYRSTGLIYNLDSTTQTSGSTYTTGDVIGVAIDCDNGEVQFYKNGVGQGATPSFTFTAGTSLIVRGRSNSTGLLLSYNFGQRPFAYTAPSGFKALCTANLPAPVVTKPSEYMDVALYQGNGSTQTISGLEFSPDLVWIKNRAAADSHKLTDTVRGATEELESDTTAAEATNADGLTQFNSDGFDLGADAEYNTNTETYVAWTWDAGSSTVTNTDGSITSSVRANPSAGFSIVTWTVGTPPYTVGHGLNAEPYFIITKSRTGSGTNWGTYHKSTGNQSRTYLNLTLAASSGEAIWNSTTPTSSVFSLGNSSEFSGDMVAYCFAPVDGYTAMSSYTGNGNADGPFVFTNMRPRWILIKRTDTTSNWTIIDTAREGYNVDNDPLFPNLSNAEGTTDLADILSNGFKLRTTDASVNANTGTYIYFAIAEAAFQFSRAR